MRVVADPGIPLVREAFSEFGQVQLVPGREITAQCLDGVDILLVRSVTRVDDRLLRATKLRFVGSATSGIEHIDRDALDKQRIGFAYAPGSNADSVADYVISVVLASTQRLERPLNTLTAGVIGHGHIGKRVVARLQALGIRCVINDPPLRERHGNELYRGLDEALATDIVTLHVPLTRSGRYPTNGLIDAKAIAAMREHSLLINAARGSVVDEAALLKGLESGRIDAALDCWTDEPRFNAELLRAVDFGTTHIAGYSWQGKVNATAMLYRSACETLRRAPRWRLPPQNAAEAIEVNPHTTDRDAVREVVHSCYDVRRDAGAMQHLLGRSATARAQGFDALRRDYPRRPDFAGTRVRVPRQRPGLAQILAGLGFQIESEQH